MKRLLILCLLLVACSSDETVDTVIDFPEDILSSDFGETPVPSEDVIEIRPGKIEDINLLTCPDDYTKNGTNGSGLFCYNETQKEQTAFFVDVDKGWRLSKDICYNALTRDYDVC